MRDPYLYEDIPVLRNLLNITEEQALDLAEAEISRANMMLLYEKGFSDFSVDGVKKIHEALFSDIYDWAGQFRNINIQKREELLGGRSVWYSNAVDIDKDLTAAWDKINSLQWAKIDAETFALQMAHTFPMLWQVHPFREGNTRTIVMIMTFFAERHGFYFDQELMAASAGYVRNSFVMASIGEHSEYEHLEKILKDAICIEPIIYVDEEHIWSSGQQAEKYKKYETSDYKPIAHEYIP